MRSPSSRILTETVDFYASTVGQSDGGVTYTYPSIPTRAGIPCSAQPTDVIEEVEAQDRVTKIRHWNLYFASPTLANPRDQFLYTDDAGSTHTLYPHGEQRLRAMIKVPCIEMI